MDDQSLVVMFHPRNPLVTNIHIKHLQNVLSHVISFVVMITWGIQYLRFIFKNNFTEIIHGYSLCFVDFTRNGVHVGLAHSHNI